MTCFGVITLGILKVGLIFLSYCGIETLGSLVIVGEGYCCNFSEEEASEKM